MRLQRDESLAATTTHHLLCNETSQSVHNNAMHIISIATGLEEGGSG